MKTVILPNTIKDIVIKNTLMKNNSLFDVEYITLDTFIKRIIQSEDNLYDIYLKLRNLSLNDLKDTVKETDFLKGLMSDADKLMKYGVSLYDLEINDDYRKCLEVVIDKRYETLNRYLDKYDFKNYEIYDTHYDIYEKSIIERMLKKGATLISLPSGKHTSYKIKLNTMRDALSAIASYIIDHNLNLNDCVIVASEEYLRYVSVILNLYGIKISARPFISSNKAHYFISLMDFYLDPSLDNYLAIVRSGYKGSGDISIIEEYYKRHVREFKLEEYTLFRNEKGYYHDNEEMVNSINEKYFDELKKLLSLDFNEALVYVFDLIKDNDDESLSIKNIIERYTANLKDSYFIYREEILNLKKANDDNGLKVIDYHEDIYYKDYIFVLKPDMHVYPGFKPLDGFIKEKSILNTTYPDIRSRFENHLELFDYFNNSKETIFFLVQSTFDGKAVEYDDAIDKYPDINIDYVINEYNDYLDYNHKINKDNARKSFIRDNELRGSISSFEKYFKCPYSYFLNYGLKLKDPELYDLNAALTGTLVHEIMEKAVRNNPKNYPRDFETVLKDTIMSYKDKLLNMYPNEKGVIEASMQRIENAIILEMEFTRFMENESDYQASKMELKFNEIFLSHNGIDLRLRGIIDRVDELVDRFRIVDYKTSVHSLSKTDIAKGIQLQLLTYALIYEKMSHDIANGVFYCNIKHAGNNLVEYKYSKKDGMSEVINDPYQDFIDDHRLKGMFFEDDDKSYKHIVTSKKTGISKRYLIDHDKTVEMITEIYEYLIDNLLDGNISLIPDDDACTYCNYHRICHFYGVKGLNKKISDIEIGTIDEND